MSRTVPLIIPGKHRGELFIPANTAHVCDIILASAKQARPDMDSGIFACLIKDEIRYGVYMGEPEKSIEFHLCGPVTKDADGTYYTPAAAVAPSRCVDFDNAPRLEADPVAFWKAAGAAIDVAKEKKLHLMIRVKNPGAQQARAP